MDVCEEAVGAEILAVWTKVVLQSALSGQGSCAGLVHSCDCSQFTLVLVSSSLLVLGLPDCSRDCCWSWSRRIMFVLFAFLFT